MSNLDLRGRYGWIYMVAELTTSEHLVNSSLLTPVLALTAKKSARAIMEAAVVSRLLIRYGRFVFAKFSTPRQLQRSGKHCPDPHSEH